jgi:hypothetical protein
MGHVKTTHPKTLSTVLARQVRKNRMYRKSSGRLSVDAQPVQQHIRKLCDAGFSLQAIAAVAGCSDSTISKIWQGLRERVATYVAFGIMNVGWKPVPEQAGFKVPACGTVRRIHALRRQGWTTAQIAEAADRRRYSAGALIKKDCTSVTYETWLAYVHAYEKLSARPGPSHLTRIRSEAAGWPSPWDWETAQIDNPDSWPKKEHVPNRNQKKAAGLDLLDRGLSASVVAERLNVCERTVERWKKAV